MPTFSTHGPNHLDTARADQLFAFRGRPSWNSVMYPLWIADCTVEEHIRAQLSPLDCRLLCSPPKCPEGRPHSRHSPQSAAGSTTSSLQSRRKPRPPLGPFCTPRVSRLSALRTAGSQKTPSGLLVWVLWKGWKSYEQHGFAVLQVIPEKL